MRCPSPVCVCVCVCARARARACVSWTTCARVYPGFVCSKELLQGLVQESEGGGVVRAGVVAVVDAAVAAVDVSTKGEAKQARTCRVVDGHRCCFQQPQICEEVVGVMQCLDCVRLLTQTRPSTHAQHTRHTHRHTQAHNARDAARAHTHR